MDRTAPPAAGTVEDASAERHRRLSIGEVAERLGESRQRVTAALDAAGIARRRPGWTDGDSPAPITAQQLTELLRALETTTTRVRFPSIANLMDHYDIRSLNTIRSAQAVLVDEGIEPEGVGAFVTALPERTTLVPTADSILGKVRSVRRLLAQIESDLRLLV